MREILFRGKKIGGDSGWVYGSYLHLRLGRDYICEGTVWFGGYTPCKEQVVPETVGQYVGLEDRNGVRIFEGDVVKLRDGTEDLYEVRRECDTPGGYWAETGFILKRIGWSGYIHFTDTIDDWENECQVVVVGNIHDNPELLKEREKEDADA